MFPNASPPARALYSLFSSQEFHKRVKQAAHNYSGNMQRAMKELLTSTTDFSSKTLRDKAATSTS